MESSVRMLLRPYLSLLMAVPEKDSDADSLAILLEEGNRICSAENEVLSDTIYYYDRGKKEFSMAASYLS